MLAALLGCAEVAGTSLPQLLASGEAVEVVRAVPVARALLGAALLALAVASGLVLAAQQLPGPGHGAARCLLALACSGLVPETLASHGGSGPHRVAAVAALVVHVVALSLWVGGLAALVLLARHAPADLAAVVLPYSAVALGCFLLVAGSGVAAAWTRLPDPATLWSSGYGALLIAKAATLAVLGAMGNRHRRATVGAVLGGRPAGFLRLAGAEVLVMAVAVGLGVALARTPG